MNVKDYQSQIETLIPFYNSADFNSMIDKVFFGESNSDKFLIKMEISRIATPCTRIIDLREKVIDKTAQYTYFNLTHYLTTAADKELAAAIKLYGGYTIGAYEQVLDYVQKLKQQSTEATQKITTDINQNITENIQLNNHRKQTAARMFFVSKIEITFEDGVVYQATTSNISISGLKIKLLEQRSHLDGQFIQVSFTTLSKEYKDKAITDQKINYRLVKQQQEKTGFYLYLNLEDDKPEFVQFIKSFIKANQHKYKLDVLYYFRLAREKSLKNSTLMAMNSLPIYLNANSNKPILFMLRNAVNKDILNDWRCENTNQLPFLFSESRLAKLLSFANPKLMTTVYSFTYITEGEEFLLSATEEELQQDNLKHLFIEYGRTKANWRCYHLTLQSYTYQAIKSYQLTDIRPQIFNDITHLATLTSISTKEIIKIDTRSEKGNPNLLNKYVHREKEAGFTPIYDLFPEELRKEERYSYSSSIALNTNNAALAGKIIDFSNSGLKIQLDTPKLLTRRSLITIDFLDLQKISTQFILKNIEYRVISSSPKGVYHLQIASRESYMTMHQFFSALVAKNPTHFKEIPLKSHKQPVTTRLHEAAESALSQAFFYVSTQNGRPKISFSSIAEDSKALKQLFNFGCQSENQNNHIALSNNRLLDRLLTAPLRAACTQQEPLNFERTIYINKIQNDSNKWSIESYLDEDFESQQSKRDFVIKYKKLNQLQILHYRLTPIEAPSLKVISSELNVISCYAMHLSKRIEDEILNINAIIEITDRTEQILGG
ncbi:PilZ domain-containing protein [uncultured Psychromonas sp.]|uniref:PilZ domain-containing protein n=1 Tax=uncultured Psychromonas sp. TaxID=173974 RepID=UPI00262A8E75|nr:PilZ domain-containing protein [uncultured Psychromonas sp.]